MVETKCVMCFDILNDEMFSLEINPFEASLVIMLCLLFY